MEEEMGLTKQELDELVETAESLAPPALQSADQSSPPPEHGSAVAEEAEGEARLAAESALGATIVGREARTGMMAARAKIAQLSEWLKAEEAEGTAPREPKEGEEGDASTERHLAQLKAKLKEEQRKQCDIKSLYSTWKQSPRPSEDTTPNTPQNPDMKRTEVHYTSEEFLSRQWRSPVKELLYEVQHTRASVQDALDAAKPRTPKQLDIERVLLLTSSKELNTKLRGTRIDRNSAPNELEVEQGLVSEAYQPYSDQGLVEALSKEAELYEASTRRQLED